MSVRNTGSPLEEPCILFFYKGYKMSSVKLNATARSKAGKGASRAERRSGNVPSVIYGDKQAPVLISIAEKDLVAQMSVKGLWTRQFEIVIGSDSYHTLCQDIQKDPITSRPIHADFLRIAKDALLTLDIPLNYINEDKCPGIKFGGVLNVVHRKVSVKCKPADIPQEFIVDLSTAEKGSSVMASSLQLPKGVSLVEKEDFTIATIVAVASDDETPAPAAEAAQPAKKA